MYILCVMILADIGKSAWCNGSTYHYDIMRAVDDEIRVRFPMRTTVSFLMSFFWPFVLPIIFDGTCA